MTVRSASSTTQTGERDVVPVGAYRLPGTGRDGVLVRHEGALVRALEAEGETALVRAWAAGGYVCFRAEAPPTLQRRRRSTACDSRWAPITTCAPFTGASGATP